MVNVTRRIGIAALTAGLLASCGTTSSQPPAPSPEAADAGTAAAPSTTTPAPVEFKLGQRVTNIPTLNYAVTSIEVDGPCPGPTIPSTHGHLLLVGLDVQTDPAFTAANARGILTSYGGAGWSIIGPDGITQTGLTSSATYICADSQIPEVFAPNQHYAYKLAFDTNHTTGTLQYQVEYVISRWKY